MSADLTDRVFVVFLIILTVGMIIALGSELASEGVIDDSAVTTITQLANIVAMFATAYIVYGVIKMMVPEDVATTYYVLATGLFSLIYVYWTVTDLSIPLINALVFGVIVAGLSTLPILVKTPMARSLIDAIESRWQDNEGTAQ